MRSNSLVDHLMWQLRLSDMTEAEQTIGGDVHGLTVRNLRAFSCRGNADGIDLMSSTDVLSR